MITGGIGEAEALGHVLEPVRVTGGPEAQGGREQQADTQSAEDQGAGGEALLHRATASAAGSAAGATTPFAPCTRSGRTDMTAATTR